MFIITVIAFVTVSSSWYVCMYVTSHLYITFKYQYNQDVAAWLGMQWQLAKLTQGNVSLDNFWVNILQM